MNKIEINLVPKKEEPKGALFEKILLYRGYLVIIFLFTTILIIFLYIFAFIRGANLNSYQNEWKKLQPRFDEISQIKNQITQLENLKKELQTVVTPNIFISKIFEEIFEALPENIWFEKLIYKNNILTINGYVVKLNEDYLITLDKFIKALNSKEYFSKVFKKVNIVGSTKTNFFGVEVLSFEIECVK